METEATVFTLVFLVLLGGLVLDVIPMSAKLQADTLIGRTLLFLVPGAVGFLRGLPEAIVSAAVVGLLIDNIHDYKETTIVLPKLLPEIKKETIALLPKPGDGGKVLLDLSPDYTGSVAKRLGLIPVMSQDEKFIQGGVVY